MADNVKLAVITGSHSFDVPNFHDTFTGLADVTPYIQHMEDFAASDEATRDSYDVVLLYHMIMATPVDGEAWWAGQPKTAVEHFGETKQGLFVLHHSILAYPDWQLWTDVTGLADRSFGFHPDQTLRVQVAAADHPVTAGLADWDMTDETYTMPDPVGENTVLLTTEHDLCMNTIAWTRQYKQSPVFCFQSGHDNQTWANENFQTILQRGILWAAGKL